MMKVGEAVVARPKITTPAHKYGPTAEYGTCEVESCKANARATCEACGGEYCLGHQSHERHAAEAQH